MFIEDLHKLSARVTIPSLKDTGIPEAVFSPRQYSCRNADQ